MEQKFENLLREDLHRYLRQLYLMWAAMQLNRMGYHMTKMS